MTTYLIVDTETSGLGSVVRACEIAFLRVDENLNILEEQVHLTDPQIVMDPGAVAIHGITNEQVAGFPSNSDICAKMPQPFTWIGHNSSYDQRVIAEHVTFNGNLCTLALARRWLPNTTNHKLATLQKELGLSEQKKANHEKKKEAEENNFYILFMALAQIFSLKFVYMLSYTIMAKNQQLYFRIEVSTESERLIERQKNF